MEIRQADIRDAEGIAVVHVESWRTTYKGIVSDEYLQSLSAEKRVEGWRRMMANLREDEDVLVIADEHGKIYGFMSFGMERDNKQAEDGELYAVYLLEEIQGQGWGRQLFKRMVDILKAKGFSTLLVWVLDGNPAIQFYRAMGGEVTKQKEIVIGGETHLEYALSWQI
ncbi:GNAT family N-acetyltransferase [Paenibacillus campinasensis]|uniref:GNAT family N-acetyltransferase n=1 Tax=Paenibacillus campinasensis TaxID=66347 RepID=A0A268EQ04_9BACL|nr:GNAT family N-acetyltransferase [Paenibacillus campinasensis]PAD75176.1 GNAT family N-acetyltransferase [Paenibacillus campinasensis]